MSQRIPSRSVSRSLAAALAATSAGSLGMAIWTSPASAQLTVFDPSNYAQNVLIAARTLSQINNQIQSLQNQSTMILNQAKNLSRIDFPELQQLKENLQAIDQLMSQARGIGFRAGSVDSEFSKLFPLDFNTALTRDARVADARSRLDASMAALSQTMQVQAQVVGGIGADATALSAIVSKSQGAEGALQASQATNQLLALAAKQQAQIQSMLAAQYRMQALEAARSAQAEAEGRAATIKFLGNGTAYHPH